MSHRSFGEINFEAPLPVVDGASTALTASDHCATLRSNIVGAYAKYSTPFGEKPVIYADWTASGRCLKNVEDYISSEVMPFYGNTHTTTSITGHQSTCFRHEARQIIAESVNAKITGKASQDLVLFCGNGTTGAVSKLISCLGLQMPLNFDDHPTLRPIIFVSKMDHHSNILPWRETCGMVVEIQYDEESGISLADLEAKLIHYQQHKVKIGTFTAASNITGHLIDTDVVTIMMHRYGGLAFFDYATAAPYVKIDMNPTFPDPSVTALAGKDGIFFSGHKFLGGPGSSGVLVVKKMILPQAEETPSSDVGGGTVFYVTHDYHRYLSNREEREEGGTPSILSEVKLGLIFHTMRIIGISWIEQKELEVSRYVTQRLGTDPRIILLGKKGTLKGRHLPIYSFLIRSLDRFLHFHFVSVLLNDLFGIQSRGGCMCAGPFAQYLLGISDEVNNLIEGALLDKHEVLRPGFTRISFPYWLTQSEIDYIIDGVLFIAEHGWKFLRYYRYNPKTGEWAHTSRLTRFPERKWLSNFALSYTKNTELSSSEVLNQSWMQPSVDSLLLMIKLQVAAELERVESSGRRSLSNAPLKFTEPLNEIDPLRWFVVVEDFKIDSSLCTSVWGPIQPRSLEPVSVGSLTQNSDAQLTAYARKRDGKLLKRDNESSIVPRFLSLFQLEDSSLTLREILRKKLMKLAEAQHHQPQSSSQSKNATSSSHDVVGMLSKYREPNNKSEQTIVASNRATCSIDCSEGGKKSSGPGRYFPSAATATGKFASPPKKVMKLVGQAIKEWNMIQDGDKLLLGLSGGKDSLALLHILKALQKRAPIKFEIACATVDPQTPSFDPSPLIPYVQSLGITYHYLSEPIVELAKSKMQGDSLCAFCSRFKRGLLYSCCRTYGYNKLVLAQHLDDLAESFFMSLLHNGQVRTMKSNYCIDQGDVRVIRPLCYVREVVTRDFSQSSSFPIINENCPACFEEPKERARVKKLLAQEEAMVPALFHNLRKALIPLMHEDTYQAMNRVSNLVEEAGYKETDRRKVTNSFKRTSGAEVVNSDESDKIEFDHKRIKRQEGECKDLELQQTFHAVMNGEVNCEGDYCAPCFELV